MEGAIIDFGLILKMPRIMAHTKHIERKRKKDCFGIVDADLLDNSTRHPNLVLMKLAGYFRDRNIPYKFLTGDKNDLITIDYLYISKVFTFTKEPEFLNEIDSKRIFRGGTGYYAEEDDLDLFNQLREEDMTRL